MVLPQSPALNTGRPGKEAAAVMSALAPALSTRRRRFLMMPSVVAARL